MNFPLMISECLRVQVEKQFSFRFTNKPNIGATAGLSTNKLISQESKSKNTARSRNVNLNFK